MSTWTTEIANDDRLTMSVQEAGVLLGVSRNHAYKLAREGAFPTIRLGRKIVVPKARFEAWINGD